MNKLVLRHKNRTYRLPLIWHCFIFMSLLTMEVQAQQMPEPIAHALGEIEDIIYSNSREALIASIEKGYKYIEVDIDSTSDGIFIASHDWTAFNSTTNHPECKDTIYSYEVFKNRKLYSKLTPITIDEIIDTLKNHPEISLVTDKISDPVIIEKCFSEIKNRVYVECFSLSDYEELKKLGYNAMYSTYTIDSIFDIIIMNLLTGECRIDFITLRTNENFKEINKLRCVIPLKTAVYTINSEEFLKEHQEDIDLFYTDNYIPNEGAFEE